MVTRLPRKASPVPKKALSKVKVKEIMNRKPATVTKDMSIEDLIERLRQQIEDCFPVVNKNRRLVGIVTESDVLNVFKAPRHRTIFFVGAPISEMGKYTASNVGEIMTERPISVTSDASVQEAIDLMVAHKLRHLPVVEKGKLVGLITLRDILDLYHLIKH